MSHTTVTQSATVTRECVGLFLHDFITCRFEPIRGRGGGPGSEPCWPLCRFEFVHTGANTARHVCGRVWSRPALAWLAERARRRDLTKEERGWLRHSCEVREQESGWSAEYVDLRWVERELDLDPGDVLRWVAEQLGLREVCWPGPRLLSIPRTMIGPISAGPRHDASQCEATSEVLDLGGGAK